MKRLVSRWTVAAWTLVACALLSSSGVASAGGGGDNADAERRGAYALVGGGVTGFTDRTAKELWQTGGGWDARVGVGSRSVIGAELAYVGSFHGAKSGSLDLAMNGADAVVRLQYPYLTQRWLVVPFAFGGIGWRYLSVQNAPAGAKDTDNIGEVPLGAGVMLGVSRFLLDVRFTFRPAFSEDLRLAGGSLNMHTWSVNAAVGIEF